MTMFLNTTDQTDVPAAATRHLQDAKSLVAAARPDGAAYLAGYVVECALKTLIKAADPGFPGVISPHPWAHLDDGGAKSKPNRLHDQITFLMATAPPHLTKYLDPSLSLLSNPVASGWSIAMRYRGPTMSATDATNWVNEADRIYAATIVPLFLDHNLGTP